MKSIPKLIAAAMVAAAYAQSAQAVNLVQIDGAHATFFYDADFWGLNTATVTGDKIAFITPSYFNQHAEGHGVQGREIDRYTNESSSAVVAVAHGGYQLTGGVNYDLTTTYAQPGAGAFASYVNINNVNGGTWNGTTFQSTSAVSQFSLSESRSTLSDGVGSGTDHATGTTAGALGSYSALALDSYLFLIAEQKGAGYSEAGLAAASYQFGVSAVPEPATYGMLLGGVALIGLVGRRRRKLLAGSALLAAGLVGNAQAVNYVEVAGNQVSFFYDADYWGLNAATVVGNKISLATPTYVNRSATGISPSEKNEHNYMDELAGAVVAVAHNGYSLTGVVGFKPTITYTESAVGGSIITGGTDTISYGSYSNGAFTYLGGVGWHSYDEKIFSNGTAQSGVSNFATENGFLGVPPSKFNTLAIDSSIYLSAIQNGVGTTSAAITYSYDFATVAVVPEPATYGMLLAGLGAMALVARRKQRKDQA
jgi:pyridoxine 5'-phosphate synthase PdxJ